MKILPLLICILFLQASVHAQQYHTYHNADSANPILNATPKPQNIISMQFFDVDGDKDLDCYMMLSGNKLVLYKNTGTATRPEYKLSNSTGLENITLPTTPYAQHFYFFDMDNDGDKDLFIEAYHVDSMHSDENHSDIQTFLNDGTPQKPHFTTASFNPLSSIIPTYFSRFLFFTFQDIDGDGDLDFCYYAIGNPLGRSINPGVYLNTSSGGNASFSKISYGTEQLYNAPVSESFYDFSGDGLPDCLVGFGEYFTHFYPNTGTPTSPGVDIAPRTTPPAPDFGNIAAVSIVDLNNDGQVEVFNDLGNYATVTPVPVLSERTVQVNGQPVIRLMATTQLPGYKYRWDYNGRRVLGNDKPFINARKTGKYVLFITDSLGTGVSLPYIITSLPAASASADRDAVVGVKPVARALSVKVYPNPFRQNITLALTGGNGAASKTIRVSDMAGRIWLTQTTSSSTVQLGSALPKGLYNLEVWENNTLAYHTKILKQ